MTTTFIHITQRKRKKMVTVQCSQEEEDATQLKKLKRETIQGKQKELIEASTQHSKTNNFKHTKYNIKGETMNK